ncbi:MAG TPA: hypothetical protein DCF89_09010 [Flavobacteriales bacterium]|nr:hypothetical protein [Flavobacteriales bacterium]|tara:strand:+ start:258 stop:1397 length:1140 start_codon:yes stop_codon:yes gene_type:complete
MHLKAYGQFVNAIFTSMKIVHYFSGTLLLLIAVCCGDNTTVNEKLATISADESNSSLPQAQLDSLNKKIRENPDSPNGYFLRSQYYVEQGLLGKAREDLNMCINMSPETAIFYLEKAKLLYQLSAQGMTKEFDNCEQYALKTLELDSTAKEAHLLLGKIYLALPNFGKALDQFNAALRIDKYYPEPYFFKGLTYARAGDTAKAVSSYITATEQNPEHYDSYMELGILYSKHDGEERNMAQLYFDNALEIKPNSIEALLAKGIFLQDNNNFQLADSCYNSILELDPKFEIAYHNKGYMHFKTFKDDLDQESKDSVLILAIEDFTSAIGINDQYVQAYHNRGLCFELMGDYVSAKVDYATALKIDPSFTLSLNALNALDKQ